MEDGPAAAAAALRSAALSGGLRERGACACACGVNPLPPAAVGTGVRRGVNAEEDREEAEEVALELDGLAEEAEDGFGLAVEEEVEEEEEEEEG